jgi:hypothetical protein
MKNQEEHLTEDRIIRAIVDKNDLATTEQNHLSRCSTCQKEKQEFEQVLSRMGDMSQEMVPPPRRRFVFPPQESRSWFRWQPAVATGLVIALLLMGIWWSSPFKLFQENGSVHIVQTIESDQQFVAEITLVEDYALPDGYLYIIGTSVEDDYGYDDYDTYDDYNDYDNYYDDELLESVIPL